MFPGAVLMVISLFYRLSALSIDAQELYCSLPLDSLLGFLETAVAEFGFVAFQNESGFP